MVQAPIQSMVSRIVSAFHPERIILFGSQASGAADDQSDVDLLIVSDCPDARREALAIRRSLAEFPVACDVIVKSPADYSRLRGIVNTIVYFADRYGKMVYEVALAGTAED